MLNNFLFVISFTFFSSIALCTDTEFLSDCVRLNTKIECPLESDDHADGKNGLCNGFIPKKLSYDPVRELFYVGIPLSDFPKLADPSDVKSKFIQSLDAGYFESFLEIPELSSGISGLKNLSQDPSSREEPLTMQGTSDIFEEQKLLIAGDKTNALLENEQFMFFCNGLCPKKLGLPEEDQDRRIKVSRPYAPYWSAVASLELLFHTFDNVTKKHFHATYYGSGVLIDRRFILTAAHNVYDKKTGYMANKITALPGLTNGTKYWEGMSTKYYVYPTYISDPSVKNDLALIEFDDEFSDATKNRSSSSSSDTLFDSSKQQEDGQSPFIFGFGYFSAKSLFSEEKAKEIKVTGFPGGAILNGKVCWLASQTMIESTGGILQANDGVIRYDIDTSKGNSGSPIYFVEYDDGQPSSAMCVGVHSSHNIELHLNEGSHITEEVFAWIQKCIGSSEQSKMTSSSSSSSSM